MIERIYLGDRAVKGLALDSWAKMLRVWVDSISRVRRGATTWDFYDAEDIEDGVLVFSGVCGWQLSPPGAWPSDYIVDYSTRALADGSYESELVAGGFLPEEPEQIIECRMLIRHHESWLENASGQRID